MKLRPVPQRTTPGIVFSNVERAISDCLGRRQFGMAEMAAVVAFFGGEPLECVFCGSTDVRRWDHLVSVKEGGETMLGNMVPACAACDDSKRHLPFDIWMRSAVPRWLMSHGTVDVEARIARIQAYVAHFGYTVTPLDKRLDAEEQAVLADIRAKLHAARAETEALIKHYRRRTGNR
jgi:hypothetical protein